MIIVTGANGFIGSVLVRELNNRGHSSIVCVDSIGVAQRPGPLSHATFAQFLTDNELLEALAGGEIAPTAIFHMGACSTTTETNWDYLQRVNLNYSKTLFEHCTRLQIPYHYASSAAVYGDGAMGFDDGKHPNVFTALNLYGRSKLEFDAWALQQKVTPPHWFGYRFFNVYGPNEYHKGDQSSVVLKAFRQINESGSLRLFRSYKPEYKDGEQLRDFVYVKDVTGWIMEIFGSEKIENGIYNMGFGEARHWLDLGRAVFKNLNRPENIEWIEMPSSIRNQYQYFTKAQMNRLFRQGLSKPKWNLEDGIQDYIVHFLKREDPYL